MVFPAVYTCIQETTVEVPSSGLLYEFISNLVLQEYASTIKLWTECDSTIYAYGCKL